MFIAYFKAFISTYLAIDLIHVEINFFQNFHFPACVFIGIPKTHLIRTYAGDTPAPSQPSQSNSVSSNVGQGSATNQQQFPQTQAVNTQVRNKVELGFSVDYKMYNIK